MKRVVKSRLQPGVEYEPALFADRPVDALDAGSMSAEKDRGGWRSYAGILMERKWADFFTTEVFLAHERPRTVIELGTGSGAFSIYLASYCYMVRGGFFTFDIHLKGGPSKRVNYRTLGLIRRLGGRYHARDVFDGGTQTLIRQLIARGGVTLIYCDDGDKPREVWTYAGCLKPGDFIGIHDYNSEIFPRDLEGLIAEGVCEQWHEELFEKTSSSNRFLRILR